jgi:hypothetical protein
MKDPQQFDRVRQYLSLTSADVKIKEYLGDGTDGAVWSTTHDTAIKVFKYDFG